MADDNERYYNQLAGSSLHRLAGLSDGIFAVAMTILVLTLAVPTLEDVQKDEGLFNALTKLVPSVVTYVASFLTLGIFWVGQQTQISQLDKGNRDYTWINLAFLLFVTLLPFSTELLARFYLSQVAVVVYWLNILVLGALILASAEYAARNGLFREETRELTMRAVRRRVYIAQALYLAATAMCVIDTRISIGLIVLLQLNFAIAPRIGFLHRI